MEGPSLFLAAEQLAPFVGKTIKEVSGNTKVGKERLSDKKVFSIFSYGKYLFFQMEGFALRIHFLLYGSFEATIKGKKVTGDYPKKAQTPRLGLKFANGHLEMYNCSVRFIEEANARETCDFTIDIMSEAWDGTKAYQQAKIQEDSEIADVLLDQKIFMGVGNIIKNEVLLLAHVSPIEKMKKITPSKLKQVIRLTRDYVFKFYEWRKKFELKNHYKIYRQSFCKICGSKVTRKWTGVRHRVSYICPTCEKLKPNLCKQNPDVS